MLILRSLRPVLRANFGVDADLVQFQGRRSSSVIMMIGSPIPEVWVMAESAIDTTGLAGIMARYASGMAFPPPAHMLQAYGVNPLQL